MGFFSWITQDTNESIPNAHSGRKPFAVTMTDDKGRSWTEQNYNGYGIFGGKDFYQLLAEMNGKKTRDEGIELAFSKEKFLSPNLSKNSNWEWVDEGPESCPDQGYFYDDSEEDDNEWDDEENEF
tara:strand:+ start:38 stop:412 length:375 start_codon:yes stop_codon:yes gene_type:complete